LLLGFAVVAGAVAGAGAGAGAVVTVVEVADGADRPVEVAVLGAVLDGDWGVRAPPTPTRRTPTIRVTPAVLRLGIGAHQRCPRIRATRATPSTRSPRRINK